MNTRKKSRILGLVSQAHIAARTIDIMDEYDIVALVARDKIEFVSEVLSDVPAYSEIMNERIGEMEEHAKNTASLIEDYEAQINKLRARILEQDKELAAKDEYITSTIKSDQAIIGELNKAGDQYRTMLKAVFPLLSIDDTDTIDEKLAVARAKMYVQITPELKDGTYVNISANWLLTFRKDGQEKMRAYLARKLGEKTSVNTIEIDLP